MTHIKVLSTDNNIEEMNIDEKKDIITSNEIKIYNTPNPKVMSYNNPLLTNMLIHPLKPSPPIISLPQPITDKQRVLLSKGWPIESFDNPIEICERLWLSGIAFEDDLPTWCKDNEFTHIVNASGDYGRSLYYKTHPKDHNIKYLELDMDDTPCFQLEPYFSRLYSFLYHAYESGGKILIHCIWGKSRSVSCLCYFIMMYWCYNYDSTIALIKRSRPFATPNEGFQLQLRLVDLARYSKLKSKKLPDLLPAEVGLSTNIDIIQQKCST